MPRQSARLFDIETLHKLTVPQNTKRVRKPPLTKPQASVHTAYLRSLNTTENARVTRNTTRTQDTTQNTNKVQTERTHNTEEHLPQEDTSIEKTPNTSSISQEHNINNNCTQVDTPNSGNIPSQEDTNIREARDTTSLPQNTPNTSHVYTQSESTPNSGTTYSQRDAREVHDNSSLSRHSKTNGTPNTKNTLNSIHSGSNTHTTRDIPLTDRQATWNQTLADISLQDYMEPTDILRHTPHTELHTPHGCREQTDVRKLSFSDTDLQDLSEIQMQDRDITQTRQITHTPTHVSHKQNAPQHNTHNHNTQQLEHVTKNTPQNITADKDTVPALLTLSNIQSHNLAHTPTPNKQTTMTHAINYTTDTTQQQEESNSLQDSTVTPVLPDETDINSITPTDIHETQIPQHSSTCTAYIHTERNREHSISSSSDTEPEGYTTVHYGRHKQCGKTNTTTKQQTNIYSNRITPASQTPPPTLITPIQSPDQGKNRTDRTEQTPAPMWINTHPYISDSFPPGSNIQ